MIPARVIGRVVPSHALDCFKGVPLLIVQPIDEDGNDHGHAAIAADAIGANTGERVFIAQGREATFPLPEKFNPADMTIVAIIDALTE